MLKFMLISSKSNLYSLIKHDICLVKGPAIAIVAIWTKWKTVLPLRMNVSTSDED